MSPGVAPATDARARIEREADAVATEFLAATQQKNGLSIAKGRPLARNGTARIERALYGRSPNVRTQVARSARPARDSEPTTTGAPMA